MNINEFFISKGLGCYSIIIGDPKTGNYDQQYFPKESKNIDPEMIHIYGDGHSANYLEEKFRSEGIEVRRHPSLCGLFKTVH